MSFSVFRLAVLGCLWTLGAVAAAQTPAQADLPPPLEPDWSRSIESLQAIQADGDGDTVPDAVGREALVAGRVTAGSGLIRAGGPEVYIQDGTGGLRLLIPPAAGRLLPGDSVLVYGAISFRAGMIEMDAPAVRTIPTDSQTPAARVLPLVERARGARGPDIEGNEGEFVEVEGRIVTIDQQPEVRTLLLLSGYELVAVTAYQSRPSPVTFDGFQVGDYVRVRGIAAQFDQTPPYTGAYGLFPLVEGDIRKAGLSPDEFKGIAWGVGLLLLVAMLWAAALRRQVRRRSEALRASEVRYGHLFDAAADPVVVIDIALGGEVVEANRAAQRAFGVDLNGDRADGRSVLLVELAADEQEATLHLAEADRRGAATDTLELVGPDGSRVPYEIVTRRLQEGRTFVAIARNVTERRAYEHGLLTAISAAEDAREQAEEAARLKSSILANMSHEIRTPLTAILGFADILREEAPPDLYEYADTIRSGGQRLLDTLNDILDFARIDAGRAGLVPEPLDAAVVVRESVALLAPLAQKKGLGLRLQSSVATVPAVHSASSLARVVTNLVGNAIKFTERGEVRVTLHGAESFFAVRVQDTGVGISDEFLPDLFEAFKQESDGHGRNFEGTGLGLAITKRLVDLMGGEIRVWSKKGEGTLFEIALPLEAPAPELPEVAELPQIESPEGYGDGAVASLSALLGEAALPADALPALSEPS